MKGLRHLGFMPHSSHSGGYYDDEGNWKRMKFCFMYCGPEHCDCGPPGGIYHDPTKIKPNCKIYNKQERPA